MKFTVELKSWQLNVIKHESFNQYNNIEELVNDYLANKIYQDYIIYPEWLKLEIWLEDETI